MLSASNSPVLLAREGIGLGRFNSGQGRISEKILPSIRGSLNPHVASWAMNFSHFPNAKILILDSNRGGPSGHISRLEEAEPFFQIGLVGRIDLAW
jgi:hypothetical protein